MEFKKALVTGATSGIGEATALLLAQKGTSLVLTGRRRDRLQSLAERIEHEFKVPVMPLAFDVSHRTEVEEILNAHKSEISKVDILINNAGLARGLDLMSEAQIEDWEQMIDTNIKGLLYMTRLLLPYMLENNRGHIVNLGSVAGRWVYPKGGVYCATKFAVRALSEGLRLDLLGTPIRVTNIEPGMVETEFSEVRFGGGISAQERAKAVYQGMTPLNAQDIAEAIYWCLNRPRHVNIQEIVIYPTDQASVQNVHRGG